MKKPALLVLVVSLMLAPLASRGAEPIVVNLDAAKTGAPISPFVYGQFIEHLGRCIYGGIWAQMLEDRKFYFPITADYAPYRDLKDSAYPVVGASPWQIIGAADGVAMVDQDVFVGDHAPRLRAGAGLRQRDLGVVAGKAYVGYVWARPLAGQAEIEVTLVWGAGAADRASARLVFSGSEYSKQTFTIAAGATTEKSAQLELRALGGDVVLGPPSLMPGDNVRGLRADTLALLKQLKGTAYRWPGGNFVSGYDWRDGIGDRDRRPPRKNPAWTGVEHNDFGTDEFLDFCREIATEPIIAVNTGFGDWNSAAQWVEYCNTPAGTLAGGWRAKNGRAQPYGVKYWCVGNEMWGPFQLGFMQLAHYTIKHNLVADAMRKVDRSIKLVGVGDIDQINTAYDPDQAKRGIVWSQGMLEACADHLDLLSEHFYAGRVPWWTADSKSSWQNNGPIELLPHVRQVKDGIRHKVEAHRKLQPTLPGLKGRVVPIAMDEWNYWHREYVYGELGCVYEWADGLGIAEGLHELYRQSDLVQIATYAQTVNVIGAIKTSKVAAEMETTGLVLQMYREHFGQIPLLVPDAFGACDIAAALTRDHTALTIAVVNPTTEPIEVKLGLTGVQPTGPATRWHLTGPDRFAHNAPGQPRAVDIQRTNNLPTNAPLPVPALGVAIFTIPLVPNDG